MIESAFFQDIASLMIAAGFVAAIFSRLRWPKVLGYLGAGILMSGNTWGGNFLVDEESIAVIGELGVVFLMFSMGLDFSTSDMKKMKSVTVPAAIFDTCVMTWLGYTIARNFFGWDTTASLFLGVAICDSATTMLAKIIGEMRTPPGGFVKYALGTSVCEDIVCIGLIALITGVASGDGASLGAVALSLGGLFVFLLAVIVIGFVTMPRLLVSVGKRNDDEALVLTLLGCCFAVSFIAYRFSYSLALGAFLVGVVAATSGVRSRLAAQIAPLRSMFAAIFFVSIGLLVDPAICFDNLAEIAILVAVVVIGKFVNCTLAAIATGESVKTAVQMGMALAQIGEFAFMVAILYVATCGEISSPMYQIVVAVSLLTTLLSPLLLRLSEPFGEWVEKHVPARLAARLDDYRAFLRRFRTKGEGSDEQKTVRTCMRVLAVLAVLEFALAVICALLAEHDWSSFSVFFNDHKGVCFSFAFNLFCLAVFAPVWHSGGILGETFADVVAANMENRAQQSVRMIARFVMRAVAVICFFAEMTVLNWSVRLAPEDLWTQLALSSVLVIVAIFGMRHFQKGAARAMQRFLEALTADERRTCLAEIRSNLVDSGELHRLTLDLASPAVGSTVVTLNVRAKTGVTIVAVERGGETIRNVGPDLEFRSGDTIVALGDSTMIAALKDLLGITYG